MSWTDALVDEAKSMWMNGASARMISEAISTPENAITRNAVIGKLTRLGIMGDMAPERKRPVRVSSGAAIKSKEQTRRYGQNSPAKKPTPLPAEPPAPETAVLWLKMGYRHCRWPINDPSPIEYHRVCGATTPEAKSYCMFHAQAAAGPGTRGERNAVPASL